MAYVDDEFPLQSKRVKHFMFPGILFHGGDPHVRRSEPNKNDYPLQPDQVTMVVNLGDVGYFLKEAPQSNFDVILYKQRYSEKGYNSLHRSLKKAVAMVQKEGAVEYVRVREDDGKKLKFKPLSEVKGTHDVVKNPDDTEIYIPKAKKITKKKTATS